MQRRPLRKRLLKWLAIILLIPYGLAFVYLAVPPTSTLMVADLVTLTIPKRNWVPLRKISPNLVAAVVTSEDSAFCDHWGFDFNQIEKSVDKAIDGKRYGGASTITQQTAKNLFLWNSRSWVRKILEAPQALWLEVIMSKRRILEIYLNIAEWGPGIYGAEAAAKYHFNTSAANLSLYQASLLAAALPNPIQRNAGKPGPGQMMSAAAIARRVLARGADLSCLK